ncbi:hypothetical protein [Naasia lichenicola]|uniref:Uncharacterized protein n=1 Tax=Naasia lichenicola TaxID=2565933 RepID=A0A4V3WTQ1_9MICO|nr:hypothetical protein [Naasia lichenicola]THG32897.1 hypothetical protein E6C64_00530 [Naasia lichenicola]
MERATPIRIFWAGVGITALAVVGSFLVYGGSTSDLRLNPLGSLSLLDITLFLMSVLSPIQQVAYILGPILIATSFVVAAIDRSGRAQASAAVVRPVDESAC